MRILRGRLAHISSSLIIALLPFFVLTNNALFGQQRCGVTKAYVSENNEYGFFSSSRSSFRMHVVFHVFTFENQNPLAKSQIFDQLDILNNDYQGHSVGIEAIPSEIRQFVGSPSISFCLASNDPDGRQTDGIIYYVTSDSDLADINQSGMLRPIKHKSLGGANAWDTERYLNIWISSRNDGILADSSNPDDSGTSDDGIVIETDVVGSYNGTNENFDRGKTLTHEVGHFLGLNHLWLDDSNCDTDDQIADTPSQEGPYFGCPAHPQQSCGSMDFIYNFMDFSDDICLRYFTNGQVTRMHEILQNERSSLSVNNCIGTDVEDGFEDIIIAYRGPTIIIRSMNDLRLNSNFTLFDFSGRRISQSKISGNYIYQLDVSDLPFGIYIVVLESSDKKIARKLLIPNLK